MWDDSTTLNIFFYLKNTHIFGEGDEIKEYTHKPILNIFFYLMTTCVYGKCVISFLDGGFFRFFFFFLDRRLFWILKGGSMPRRLNYFLNF